MTGGEEAANQPEPTLARRDGAGEAVAIEILGLTRRGLDPRAVNVTVSTADDVETLPDDHPGHQAFARG